MKSLYFFTLIFFLLSNSLCVLPAAKDQFTSLNPLIDVGENRIVQHDENNDMVYDLKKRGNGTTTVYEIIYPEFTANKAWTNKGDYIDNVVKKSDGVTIVPHGATAPDDFIPVKPGEQYFIRTYGVGGVGSAFNFWYAPVLFFDANDKFIKDILTNTYSKSKAGVTFTVPDNSAKMHITMFGHQGFTLQKVLNVTDSEFDRITMNRTKLEEEIDTKYEKYKKDKVLYKRLDKAYITIVNDDTRSPMDVFANLFIEKKFPLVLATLASQLMENASSEKETRLQVCRRVVQAGGEIIAHNGGVITKDDFTNYNKMFSFFVKQKQILSYHGFDVNGIILAGGNGQVPGAAETERWASTIYSYSDLYGQEYDNKDISLDHVYYHYRQGLGNFWGNFDKMKAAVDEAISKKMWKVFYFHDDYDIKLETMEKLIDYIQSIPSDQLEIVTYKQMYTKFAEKESVIKNTAHTYYVSADGKSKVGTSMEDPLSYEEAQNKVYISGDTVLFRKGDIFYGSFSPKIAQVNNKITTFSSYGVGELPVISAYKIADKLSSWVQQDSYYKINLKNTTFFSGIQTIDDNSVNIGFIELQNRTKFYNRKSSLSSLSEPGDFYCDGTYLYLKSETNPFTLYGVMKLATRTNLMGLHSNLKITNIRFVGTGAHGLAGSSANITNLEITNCVVQDIGGSYLKGTTRYGNGIELYGSNAYLVKIKHNIIKNVYDVGFTMQGTSGSGKYVVVSDNVFVANSQDSEIWESGTATGIESYEFTDNISINQGRGWGYMARPDKYVAGHILFWGYTINNTDIFFHHNIVYNPRRVYFIEQTYHTIDFFKLNDYIKSDYNRFYLALDAYIFRDWYRINTKDNFISDYNKDHYSTFTLIEPEQNIINVASSSLNINEIRELVKGL